MFLEDKVERTRLGTYKFKRGVAVGEGEEVFARFEFPILQYTKAEMKDIAKRQGFIEILEKSWFCHEPINAANTQGLHIPQGLPSHWNTNEGFWCKQCSKFCQL